MGLGTGLNAWLTLREAAFHKREIRYTAVEKFPLSLSNIEGLNYGDENKAIYELLHHCKWDQPQLITNDFVLHKIKSDLFDYKNNNAFHLIYYDAFAPRAQPELWTIDVFQQVYNLLLPGGILVTYCAKGDVRRNLLAAGFIITKLPGPPGKREMIRAEKNVASLL
jgi:tRNA U34 5-methylaminomethyl-2-thiouridine-forming methyltransferase MnmC